MTLILTKLVFYFNVLVSIYLYPFNFSSIKGYRFSVFIGFCAPREGGGGNGYTRGVVVGGISPTQRCRGDPMENVGRNEV